MTADPLVDLDFSLADKVAVVTGGASGIGAAIATAYVRKGAKVAILDVSPAAAAEHAERLGDHCAAFACDVTAESSVTDAVGLVQERFGRIDILVNSAGVAILAPAEKLDLAAWTTTLAVNLTGAFLMCRRVGAVMLAQGHGRVINLASQAASVALTDHAAYCASKFGLVGLTKVLASEWASRGVTANTISPTVVLSDLGRKAWAGARATSSSQIRPGASPTPTDRRRDVFLASDAAAMIYSADLRVDGGYAVR
jgi:NAD(P)-dependent dehydrogenase (short-subunit alcohol dehydrogenase family)